jgi:hypothetical protein
MTDDWIKKIAKLKPNQHIRWIGKHGYSDHGNYVNTTKFLKRIIVKNMSGKIKIHQNWITDIYDTGL